MTDAVTPEEITVRNTVGSFGCQNGSRCDVFLSQFLSRLVGPYLKTSARGLGPEDALATLVIDDGSLDWVDSCMKTSKSAAKSQVRKAIELGYTVEEFDWNSRLDDVFEINTSLEFRSGGPLKPSYKRPAKELADSNPWPVGEKQECPMHFLRTYGVFTRSANDGSKAGKLVGYVRVKRHMDVLVYSQILGHGNFLADGVMYLLHRGLVESISNDAVWHRPAILLYNKWVSGGDGLRQWKKKAGFRPRYLLFGGKQSEESE